MICGLILSGGESRRMNSPKALLKIQDETFVACILRKMKAANLTPVIIVTGPHHEAIRQAIDPADAIVIRNPKPEQGQFSSLRCGVSAIPSGAEGVVVWPVDQPQVSGETVATLLQSFQIHAAPVVIPTNNGRRGHPVIYSRPAINQILTLDLTHTAKDLQAIYQDSVCHVEVNDASVLQDVDTPADYKDLIDH